MSTNSTPSFLERSVVAIENPGPDAHEQTQQLTFSLRSLGQQLGWANNSSAFGKTIPQGAKVLVKPNFVLHENNGPWPFEAVVSSPAIVRAVVAEILRSGATEVAVGDAPVQGCDFDALLKRTGLGSWATHLAREDSRFAGIVDFRRTTATFQNGIRTSVREDKVNRDKYVLFDLAEESLLEPVTSAEPRFRVTCYDPQLLAQTHSQGRHQYLIARHVLDADVVVNLPKLKMHKKAGVTNALKNLVGVNGNKEYLPHHRIGGSNDAGDCYPGKSRLKEVLERLYDFQNSSTSTSRARLVAPVLHPLTKLLSLGGDETGVEGSWFGNDTVWRMSLDLNRIVLYGRPDGTMAQTPQRSVLHVCDAIIAGQGNGPLAPEPFPLGLMLAGENAAAVDFAGARLLNLDPDKVPIVRGAFESFRWPLSHFSPSEISVRSEAKEWLLQEWLTAKSLPMPWHVPAGWTSVVLTGR